MGEDTLTYKLYIDSNSIPSEEDFIIAKSSSEAIDIVKTKGDPIFVSFAHDLDGYDTSILFVTWYITKLSLEPCLCKIPFDWKVHSPNKTGRKDIDKILKRWNMYVDIETYHEFDDQDHTCFM